jgi:hypothetical protein
MGLEHFEGYLKTEGKITQTNNEALSILTAI